MSSKLFVTGLCFELENMEEYYYYYTTSIARYLTYMQLLNRNTAAIIREKSNNAQVKLYYTVISQ